MFLHWISPPLVCNTKTDLMGRKTCHPHSTSLSWEDNFISSLWVCVGGCFLLKFVGPFFIHCLGVSYGELGSSSPTEPAFYSSVLMDHPPPNSHQISIPNPDTCCSPEPDVCLQLSLCIAFKSNAMFLYLLLNSVNTKRNKTKSRKYKQIAKQIAVYGRYYAKYFI